MKSKRYPCECADDCNLFTESFCVGTVKPTTERVNCYKTGRRIHLVESKINFGIDPKKILKNAFPGVPNGG